MLQYSTPDQLAQRDKELEQTEVGNNQALQQNPIVDSLAGVVRSKWEIAKTHKAGVTDRLTDCLRRRKGEYSPTQLADIKGSKVYMKITSAKCVGAKAWLSDLFNNGTDKPFTLDPTPIPELPPEIHEQLVMEAMQGAMALGLPEQDAFEIMKQHEERLINEMMQEAQVRMEKMEDHIQDVLVEGDWRKTFDDFLDDFVTYPVAIMTGINFKQKKRVKWVDVNGEHIPKHEMSLTKEFSRLSPFDAYPSPTTKNGQPSYMCEHVRFSPVELANNRNLKGYDAKAIFQVLSQYRNAGHREWIFNENERQILESGGNQSNYDYDLIDGVKYSGYVQGQHLIDFGMTGVKIDPVEEYSVSIIVIGAYTIKAMINPDPASKPNYYCASWRPVPSSFWGEALPETIADIQDAANATARALINNMALGASPMVMVDVSKTPDGKVPSIEPMKTYVYDGSQGMGQGAGISVFQFEIRAREILEVYERFVRYADEISGMPSYAFGSDNGAGAAKTASGLSMLMNAAGKNMKAVVRTIDINVVEPIVEHLYNILMLDPETPKDAKGDAKVKARGSDALMHKESMSMRQQELLAITNNPTDLQLTGLEGRREMLKGVLSTTDMSVDDILYSQEELMQQQQQQMQQPVEQPQ